jgi:hypothetical protein
MGSPAPRPGRGEEVEVDEEELDEVVEWERCVWRRTEGVVVRGFVEVDGSWVRGEELEEGIVVVPVVVPVVVRGGDSCAREGCERRMRIETKSDNLNWRGSTAREVEGVIMIVVWTKGGAQIDKMLEARKARLA